MSEQYDQILERLRSASAPAAAFYTNPRVVSWDVIIRSVRHEECQRAVDYECQFPFCVCLCGQQETGMNRTKIERDLMTAAVSHWFIQGGRAQYGDIGQPCNTDELVAAILAAVRVPALSGRGETRRQRHGTASEYSNFGCRCVRCRAAWSRTMSVQQRRTRGMKRALSVLSSEWRAYAEGLNGSGAADAFRLCADQVTALLVGE